MCGTIPEDCPLQKESEVYAKPSWMMPQIGQIGLLMTKMAGFWWDAKPIFDNDFNEYLPGDDVSEWGMAEQSNINTRSIYSAPNLTGGK